MQGATVGSYVITGLIGEGGMGVVYGANHVLLGRPAAIKVLLPEFSRNQDIVNRFFNEARAATSIRHPGIVEIYDFGYLPDGSAYIAMELLEGQSLAGRLAARRALPSSEALWLVRQIAGALGAAHARSIVHRDLKPDNVFLVRDPEVPTGERIKLLDFGIAKLSGDQGQSQRTRTGAVMGTPTYMAPEQCRGVQVDHRADIYSLGCILFEMLCGRAPFVGEGTGDVLAAHIHVAPPSARATNPEVTPEVDAFILQLLAKDPAARPQSAEQVTAHIDALGAVLGRPNMPALVSASPYVPAGSAPSLSPPTTLSGAASAYAAPQTGIVPPSRPRTGLWAGIGAMVVAGGVVAAIAMSRGGAGGGAPASEPAAAAALAPEPQKQPAPEPEQAAPTPHAPARVTLTIDSTPRGAAVLAADGAQLGVTPLHLEQPPAEGTLQLTLRLAGYKDRTLDVPAGVNVDRAVDLEKNAPVPRSKKPPKKDPDPKGHDRNESVNPY